MKAFRTYSLEWLDSLVSVTLNPQKPYRLKLREEDISLLIEKVPMESLQVQAELTCHFFAINKENQVRHMITKYYGALRALRHTLQSYQSGTTFGVAQLRNLEVLIINSLNDLIDFVEKRFAPYIMPSLGNNSAPKQQRVLEASHINIDKHKVLCTLSADQIALILRAADESQILKARSMNAVFKFIIPFLSTPHKENLSAAAVRSKAYNPEEADRDAAVEALYRVIKKIQGY